jgi:hypothetical protein
VPFPASFRPFTVYEAETSALRWYEHSLVPGLLQTEGYARAVLSTRPGSTEDQIEEQVAARLRRQEVLSREDPPPPPLYVLLDEGVWPSCLPCHPAAGCGCRRGGVLGSVIAGVSGVRVVCGEARPPGGPPRARGRRQPGIPKRASLHKPYWGIYRSGVSCRFASAGSAWHDGVTNGCRTRIGTSVTRPQPSTVVHR